MSYRTKRIIFITPFYIIFEFFLFKYLFRLFGMFNDYYFIGLAVVLGLIHLIPMFFEAHRSTFLGRVLCTFDGIWMWASLMIFIELFIIYLANLFVPVPLWIVLAALLIVALLGIYNYHKAHKLVVKEKTLKVEGLSKDINIIHLSDIHFGSTRYRPIVHQVCETLKQLENVGDLIVLSGDLADGSCAVFEDDFSEFRNINLPIIFSAGNHDFFPGIESVLNAARKAGMIILDGECYEHENINIYGIPYTVSDKSMPDVGGSVIKEGFVNILNYHVPYYWEEFSSLGFDIQLSGHTHGGQFYPGKFYAELKYKYNIGLFKNNDKYLHVTTGVGSTDIPMRWGTDSEIVILKLRKK